MTFLLLKLCGRSFVVKKEENGFKNFIVSEFNEKIEENETIELGEGKAFQISGGKITKISCKVKVIKILKKHIKSFVKIRRKRHTRLCGYVQKIAYISIIDYN